MDCFRKKNSSARHKEPKTSIKRLTDSLLFDLIQIKKNDKSKKNNWEKRLQVMLEFGATDSRQIWKVIQSKKSGFEASRLMLLHITEFFEKNRHLDNFELFTKKKNTNSWLFSNRIIGDLIQVKAHASELPMDPDWEKMLIFLLESRATSPQQLRSILTDKAIPYVGGRFLNTLIHRFFDKHSHYDKENLFHYY